MSGATEYLLWVNDASREAKINMTYSAAAAGCGAGTGTCTVSPGVTLGAGGRDLVDPHVEHGRPGSLEYGRRLYRAVGA